MALQKVTDAMGITYYVDVTKLPADSQGRIGNRQRFEAGNGSVISSATVTQETAGATTSEILAENSDRIAASFFNTSLTETAYINIGAAATTDDIPIRPGEWLHMKDFGVQFTEAINAIRGGSTDVDLVVVHG